MKKKKNILKRNSGFIVGCLLAAGASYFTADAVMTRDLASMLLQPQEDEMQGRDETDTAETLAPETDQERVFETDAFTVTASGNIIKGVEPEIPQQAQTESESETNEGEEGFTEGSENAGTVSSGADSSGTDSSGAETGSADGSDGSGSYDDGGYYAEDGYSEEGSYSDGSYEQPIEIQDPGNGSYTYGEGGGESYQDDGSGGNYSDDGSAWTPSDVIIQGISSRYISEEELYNYDAGQLRLIRNEIFALNGRIFNSQDLRDYFSQKSWYVPKYPPEEFDANMFYYLNDYEEANLQVILNYEAALAGN